MEDFEERVMERAKKIFAGNNPYSGCFEDALERARFVEEEIIKSQKDPRRLDLPPYKRPIISRREINEEIEKQRKDRGYTENKLPSFDLSNWYGHQECGYYFGD